MSSFKNKTILITGGASGIGLLMAKAALKQGASKLIIWDVSQENIDQAEKELKEYNGRVHSYRVDIAETDPIHQAAQEVLRQLGPVDILINNVGIVVGKSFADHSNQDINRTIAINLSGAMHTSNAFLPAMLKQKSGHIVNIASAAGLMANPNMSVYAASKWGLIGWSESLRIELEQQHSGIRVTTVEPSYIDTDMFAGVKPPLLTPLLEPEAISDAIIRAVQQNKIILRKPFMVKLIPFLKGIMPARMFDFIAGKLFNVYTSMDTFQGRKSD
jgi:short-subunit dehydrogenase